MISEALKSYAMRLIISDIITIERTRRSMQAQLNNETVNYLILFSRKRKRFKCGSKQLKTMKIDNDLGLVNQEENLRNC